MASSPLRTLLAIAMAPLICAAANFVDVCCSGAASACAPSAHSSVAAGVAALSTTARPATLRVDGVCQLSSTLTLPEGVSLEGAAHATLAGGMGIPRSWFVPPSAATSALHALPPAVLELDLAAHSIDAGSGVFGGRGCRTYAEALPQPHSGNMGSSAPNSPPGLELFALATPSASGSGPAVPLRLAQYPKTGDPRNWSHVEHVGGKDDNRTFVPDADTLTRAQGWRAQLAADPGSVFVNQWQNAGWADFHWPVTAITVNNLTFGSCYDLDVGEAGLRGGNAFTTYNLISEISEEGDYAIDRAAKKLYAWLPAPAAAAPPNLLVAWASLLETPLLELRRAGAGQSVSNLALKFGRGVGLSIIDSADVSVSTLEVAFVGLMGVNVSGGSRVTISDLDLHDTGNGGVYLNAGDRATLTPSNHLLERASITRYNRYTRCYTPGLVFCGVGHTARELEIYDAPHQAVFASGENHVLTDSLIHDVTQIVKDSGAWYMGRDLTYRGQVIRNVSFYNLNSVFPGTPALYADDCASSVAVIECRAWNNSGPFFASEGGKGHVFIGNRLAPGQRGAHVVGKGCTGALPFLALVPWNTSAVWAAAFPELLTEMAEGVNDPWHLHFENNTFCNGTAFMDMSVKEIQGFNGTAVNNTQDCTPWV